MGSLPQAAEARELWCVVVAGSDIVGTSEYKTFERRRCEECGNTFRKLSMGGRHRLLEQVSSDGANGRRGGYKEHRVYLDKSNELVSCPT